MDNIRLDLKNVIGNSLALLGYEFVSVQSKREASVFSFQLEGTNW